MALVTESVELQSALRRCRRNFLVGFFFHSFVELTALTYPIFMIQVFSRVVPSRSYSTIIALLGGVFIVVCFRIIFNYLRSKLLIISSAYVDRTLSDRIFRALLEKSASARDETGAQVLRDFTQFRQFFAGAGILTAMAAPWGGLFVGVLFAISPLIGVVALALLLLHVILMIANMRATKRAIRVAGEARSDAYRFAEANIRSADAIVAMGMLPGLARLWRRRNDVAVAAETAGSTTGAAYSSIEATFTILQSILVLTAAAVEVMAGVLPHGLVFAAVIVFGFAQRPVHQMIHQWEGYLNAKEAGERVAQLLGQVPAQRVGMALPRPRGEILCKQVVYFPRTAERPILRGLGLHIEAGTSLGIVGPIGSGKSTLVRMLVGLIRPTDGEVRLDGAEIWSWNHDELGRYIGYLPQEIGIVAGTVSENIGRFGLFGEDEIVAAAERAGCHQLILRLPRGYDTPIGDGGHPVSGGQRQLIGLARAVCGSPSLVVLDEPNSNLDGPSEAALVACLKHLKSERTTIIMVSHRPALVQDLDRIALLRDGAIQLVVPAEEFMARSGRPVAIRGSKSEG